MFRLIQRSRPPYEFRKSLFRELDEAVWAARESHGDYLIEETSETGASLAVKKYRLGKFEMG
jgi:hypothetical protein